MNDNPERIQEFKAAVAEMKLRDPSTQGERRWLGVGMALMIGAIVVSVYAFVQSGKEGQLEQNELISLGIVAVVLALIGIGLFLRYSFARLLRFWLIRLIYEMRAVSDRTRDEDRTPVA
jgi:hypothetical protein